MKINDLPAPRRAYVLALVDACLVLVTPHAADGPDDLAELRKMAHDLAASMTVAEVTMARCLTEAAVRARP